MKIFYTIGIAAYSLLINLAAIFKTKAKLWVEGRKNIFTKLHSAFANNTSKVAWFHCASLGEFEQARPVIEAFKIEFPDYKILLTFFSPSGYEIRKNYELADYVFYLPIDTAANASKWVASVKPTVVFFTKYEFWYHYLVALRQAGVKIISFSAIFNSNQVFFKWYGSFYLKFLTYFDCIFVQNIASKNLLVSHHIHTSEVAGDTRFDRVFALATSAKKIAVIEEFKTNAPLLLAGSVWEKDLEIILPTLCNTPHIKTIIAPHEIKEDTLAMIEKMSGSGVVRFSKIEHEKIQEYKTIIIDNIGMLSSLYSYATIAYIGGGFGKGIHNTLEAATFGMPIIFGPQYTKFQEAKDMIDIGCAFSIKDEKEFKNILYPLLETNLDYLSTKASSYVAAKLGATSKIITYCKKHL